MAYLTTGRDLALDALGLAGEPADGTSEYEGDVYEWLTVVQRALVSGGLVGPAVLQPVDWLWARRDGVLQWTQPYNAEQALTIQLENGTATFGITPDTTISANDLTGYRLVVGGQAPRPVVLRYMTLPFVGLELVAPWAGETLETTDWVLYRDTYDLPADFVRGCSPLWVHGWPYRLDVVEPWALEARYPVATLEAGTPVLAARVGERALRFSHYPELEDPSSGDFVVQHLEFTYIAHPEVIAAGTIPVVPIQHRRVLSYGAAALILDDKDDSGAQSLAAQFTRQYQAMLDEHRKSAHAMSTRWGVLQPPRLSGCGGPVGATTTGLPLWVW